MDTDYKAKNRSKRFLFITALLVTTVLSAAACEPAPAPAPAPAPKPPAKKNLGHVLFAGDSIMDSSRANITWRFGMVAQGKTSFIAHSGTAPCDIENAVINALKGKDKPKTLVMESYGNNLTPCVGAVNFEGGHPQGSAQFMKTYEDSMSRVATVAKQQKVRVVWATAPPRHPSDAAPDLNGRLDAIARRLGWEVVDAGAAVSGKNGWVRDMKCLSDEPAKGNGVCVNGRAQVRSDDLVHFEQKPGYNAGSWRWSKKLVDSL